MAEAAKTPEKIPKSMSSRLLTMKFMQRAANSPSTQSTTTPEQQPAKRQKTVDSPHAKFNVDSLADTRAIQAAIAEEESRKQAALDRQAAESNDTHWVLNFPHHDRTKINESQSSPRVIHTGFASIDHGSQRTDIDADLDSLGDREPQHGRRSFGIFNKSKEKSDIRNGDGGLPSSEKKKKKSVKLDQLTSISSSGASGSPAKTDQKCHSCGESGHFIADCPNRSRRRGREEAEDRPRKSRKSR